MRRDNGLLRTIAVYAPLTLQQEYYLLLVVASSESRLCAQFVPSPVKRRKRLQLQEFHSIGGGRVGPGRAMPDQKYGLEIINYVIILIINNLENVEH